jgi:SAM-dependent methyltransferase
MIEPHEINRQFWNEVTPVHARSAMYDVEGFLKGRSTLDSVESAAFGDVNGKSVLHLQCHFGLSTMDWARRGARATGADFSDVAIQHAQEIARQAGLQERVRFIQSDVLELDAVLNEEFDFVFTSYGAICWLSDLRRWGQVIVKCLKKGGTFFIADVHPAAIIYEEPNGTLIQIYDYFSRAEGYTVEAGRWPDYADPTYVAKSGTREWQWTIADVVTALLEAGLTITALKEYDHCCFQMFPRLVRNHHEEWVFPKGEMRLPMTFAVTAVK